MRPYLALTSLLFGLHLGVAAVLVVGGFLASAALGTAVRVFTEVPFSGDVVGVAGNRSPDWGKPYWYSIDNSSGKFPSKEDALSGAVVHTKTDAVGVTIADTVSVSRRRQVYKS